MGGKSTHEWLPSSQRIKLEGENKGGRTHPLRAATSPESLSRTQMEVNKMEVIDPVSLQNLL